VKSALLLTVIIGFLVTGCSGSRPGNLAGSWYVITLPSPALVLFNPTGAEYRSAGTTPSDTIFLAHTFDDSVRASLFLPRFVFTGSAGRLGTQENDFSRPVDLTAALSVAGEPRFLITDAGNRRLSVCGSSGDFLFAMPVSAGEEPLSAIECGNGNYLVADCALRALFIIDRFGKSNEPILSLCNRPLSNRLKVRMGRFNRILCVDTRNDRVLYLDQQGHCVAEFSRAGGLFFSRPSDACFFTNTICVLDQGNGRVASLRENGALNQTQPANTLSSPDFMVACGSLLLVFSEEGRCSFFDIDLRRGPLVTLGKRFVSGIAAGQGRVALLSREENLLALYRLDLEKSGEAWARRLP